MLRITAVLASILALAASARADETGFSILMKGHSAPGKNGEILVFVGEHVSYERQALDCGEGCWVFDDWHTARYRVAKWIHGVPTGPELEFGVAEHAARVPFGHARFSLVFVERRGDALELVKYQAVAVHPTAEGGFATCGPLWGPAAEAGAPLDPASPPLEDIAFSPRLVVDDARRFSVHGRKATHDPRWLDAIGDHVVCRRGVPLDAAVRAIVARHDMLRAALPELLGDAR